MLELVALTGLPHWYLFAVIAVLGAVLASFVNVVVYRMHTGASLSGRSRCFACGHTLSWYELIPVVSYTVLRGRCRACQAHIPTRDFVVEIVSAGLFVAASVVVNDIGLLLLTWLLICTLVAVSLYDLAHFIIPNELVVTVLLVTSAIFVYTEYANIINALAGLWQPFLIAAGFYAALWKLSGGRWLGFGDVKLAAALAPALTVSGAFSMVVLSFWIGAVVGVLLLVVSKALQGSIGPLRNSANGLTTEIPFAPFIVAAFLVVYMYGIDVLVLFTL